MLEGYKVGSRLRWWIDIGVQRQEGNRWWVRVTCPQCQRGREVRADYIKYEIGQKRYTALCRGCRLWLRHTVIGRARIRQLHGRLWKGRRRKVLNRSGQLVQTTYRRKAVWGAPRGPRRPVWNWLGQAVGNLYVQSGVYEKRLKADQFYRIIPGISISVEVLEQLKKGNCRWILVTNRNSLDQWWVSFQDFRAKAVECERHEDWPLHYVLGYDKWERLPVLQPQMI